MDSKTKLGRGFYFCYGSFDPSEAHLQNKNDFSQWIYALDGSVTHNGEVLNSGLNDKTAFAGQDVNYVAGPDGLSWIAINPLNGRLFSAKVLTGKQTIVGSDSFEVICNFKGTFVANDKVFEPLNFSVIIKDKVVNLDIPTDSVCILLTETNS